MGLFKHKINPPFSITWAERVGKLILNFGGLELETLLWLVQFSEAPDRVSEYSKMRFALRVKAIMNFAEARAYSDDWRVRSLEFWHEALAQAKIRNRIAHSPLTFWWDKEVEDGEPDFIGVIDLQGGKPSENPLISKSELDQAINSIVSLQSRLETLRTEWCSIRDSKLESKTDS